MTELIHQGVAFTGTQDGMTEIQADSLTLLLPILFSSAGWKLRHGDCIGADEKVHRICRGKGFKRCYIHIYPPTNGSKRAFCTAEEYERAAPYLERNHAMVDAVTTLVGAPKAMVEELRSGTWATIRYARKRGRLIFIVYPDGSVWFERDSTRYEVDLYEWRRRGHLFKL